MTGWLTFGLGGLICATLLAITFLVLLAAPRSKLRDFLMPFLGWAVSAASVAYVISPIDVLPEIALGPFGLIDDIMAIVVAIASAMTAIKASREAKQLPR
jgi:uncharacterized membrane protein YkvA (DUF1232 family)